MMAGSENVEQRERERDTKRKQEVKTNMKRQDRT